uniref:Prefoldin subunit alpha n=1 Tax=uncultured marine group II/III euryarchaeote AD1000_114_C07 TaxID=1457719 RepID=A0A075FJA9_9EURY|nr:putative chaperonin cofactor prefoldin [uncultured marine group II/III euryarchaeote AD1000_114_C07]
MSLDISYGDNPPINPWRRLHDPWACRCERGRAMSDAAELQRLSRLVEMYRQQLTALGEQIERLSQASVEHQEVIQALESLDDESSPKIMIPLGSGTQLLVDQPNNPGVVVDIGSGIQAEKSVSEAIEILKKRVSDIEELISTLQTEFNDTELKVKDLAAKFTNDAEVLQTEEKEQPLEEEAEEPTPSKPVPKRRKRSASGELTLDD